MADPGDSGIDKQKILAEIGAVAPGEGGGPTSGSAALPASSPGLLGGGGLSAMAPPTLPAPAPAPAPVVRPPQGRFARHRSQIAGLVLVFVGMIWLALALATHERVPLGLGGGCLALALAVGLGALLR